MQSPAKVGTSVPFARPALPDVEPLLETIRDIFETGALTKGQHLAAFEESLADHLDVKHAVCVSSCTCGLALAYQALELEGEAVVPSFTFMATVSAMRWAGIRPVFVDVDQHTTNIDPAAIEASITSKTSAIVAVHNFGNPADIDALEAIAKKHGLKLVFDAAHAFGSRYQGQPVAGQGDVQVFSLSPTKLVVAGEGGVVATNDDQTAERIRLGREYGNDGRYDSLFAGLNARMPEINAIVGLNSLAQLDDVVDHRNRIARAYRQGLADVDGIEFIQVRPADRCSYKDFSIVVDAAQFGCSRDDLADSLAGDGIDTRKYYDPPVHRQTAYREFCDPTNTLSNTERLAACSLSLPLGPHVTDEVAARVCDSIRSARRAGAVSVAAETGWMPHD